MARDQDDPKPVLLAAIRAAKTGDGSSWSVEDALREALRMIKDGEITPDLIYIALRERNPDNSGLIRYPNLVAGQHNLAEVIGLLEIHIIQTIIHTAHDPTEDD